MFGGKPAETRRQCPELSYEVLLYYTLSSGTWWRQRRKTNLLSSLMTASWNREWVWLMIQSRFKMFLTGWSDRQKLSVLVHIYLQMHKPLSVEGKCDLATVCMKNNVCNTSKEFSVVAKIVFNLHRYDSHIQDTENGTWILCRFSQAETVFQPFWTLKFVVSKKRWPRRGDMAFRWIWGTRETLAL